VKAVRGNKRTMEEKICERVLSLECKVKGVIGDESKDGDCDEVICAG